VKILDGRAVAKKIRGALAQTVTDLKAQHGITPTAAMVLVGEDPASESYVKLKSRISDRLGIHSRIHRLQDDVDEQGIVDLITSFNADDNIHGILIQLPLPPHLHEDKIITLVSPEKDVDGLHPLNYGRLLLGLDCLVSPAAQGILALLDHYHIDLKDKHLVIVGVNKLLGKPLALSALNRGATLTLCDQASEDLQNLTRLGDVLVVDVGVAGFIHKSMVKKGSVVIDCGNNYVEGKVVGDVAFDEVKDEASAITPVPGGVGPMLVAMLMANIVKAAKETS
jgi:methylenetetrahydrofolate dehydrogenase (NADP+)/methenyltetrahydrofolate cyclohydrolase